MEKLSFASGGLIPQTDGTLSGLRSVMARDNITKSVLLGIATNEKQQQAVNDFVKSCEGDNIIPFGSVYPHSRDALCELERIKAMGLRGIKFHPEYQQFFVDDEKMIMAQNSPACFVYYSDLANNYARFIRPISLDA